MVLLSATLAGRLNRLHSLRAAEAEIDSVCLRHRQSAVLL